MKNKKEHHPFCNYWTTPIEECKFCPRYFKNCPITPGQTTKELIKEHFPNVKILDK